MARVKRGVTAHARHKKVLDLAKGYRGRSKDAFRIAIEKVEKGLQYAYRDRRNKKRDFRGLWIQRINAGAREHGLTYSQFIPHPPTNLSEVRHAVDTGLIIVTGGLHPGQSTNGTAALIAEKIHADEFLNATDVDGVYDKDPNKFKNAKKFTRIDLKTLRSILLNEESVAGGYDLMDIVALKIIERSKIKTRILHADIKILEKAIKGADVGTTIIFRK